MRLSHFVAGAAALCATGISLAQVAVLHNGVQVTLKIPQETFSIEGPLWDIDVANRQLLSTGYKITIPATLNGELFTLGNTQIVNNEEVSLGEITAATFDRLSDANAAMRDPVYDTSGAAGPIRLGPARSLYSTSEARSTAVGDLDRDPIIEKRLEDNYFFLARNAFAQHEPGVLPANFLGLIGIRTETGGFPTNASQLPPRRFWRYPVSSGATVIAQGSVYVDAKGNEYNIPDFAVKGYLGHVLMAENVLIGNLKAAAIGNFQTPDSLVIGDTLAMLNQDPRMPMDIIGIAGSPVSREHLMSGAVPPGTFVAAVGHMVGEHVMFIEVLEVDTAFDPANGAWVSVIDRTWRFNPGRGLSYRGDVVPASSTDLYVQYGNTVAGVWTPVGLPISLDAQLIVDPLTDSARFDIRDQAGADPATARELKFIVRPAGSTTEVIREEHFNWAEILGL